MRSKLMTIIFLAHLCLIQNVKAADNPIESREFCHGCVLYALICLGCCAFVNESGRSFTDAGNNHPYFSNKRVPRSGAPKQQAMTE